MTSPSLPLPDLPDGLTVDDLAFAERGGLLPAVVQHAEDGRVLMVGHQDRAALIATLESGLATFFSRSRGRQWTKGETSGHTLRVVQVAVDCDRDTVLLRCLPAGPACHTGADTCFDHAPPPDAPSGGETPPPDAPSAGETPPPDTPSAGFLTELDALVAQRRAERPHGSYTTQLFDAGTRRIAQKVGEEGVETALAAVALEDAELLGESADLVYHLLVLLRSRGLSWSDLEAVLHQRHTG